MDAFRTAVDDACDLDAIRAVLACARDRKPRVERAENGIVRMLEMTWVRTDSPKRAASLRISCLDARPAEGMDAEALREMAETILAQSLVDETSSADLHRWHADLSHLAAFAADEHVQSTGKASIVDTCHATAGTPWASPSAGRGATERRDRDILRTLDAAAFTRIAPEIPRIVLVRTADFSRKGGARVALGPLHGSSSFQNDPMTLLRAHARFGTAQTDS